jgi:chromosome segregation ATPase
LAKKSRGNDQLSIEGTEELEILARLTERVDKAVELIQKLRKENEAIGLQLAAKEKELETERESRAKAEAGLAELNERQAELEGERGERLDEAESELERLRDERKVVRARVESVLERLESLES